MAPRFSSKQQLHVWPGVPSQVIGAVGASVTFPIQPPAGRAVFWTFGNDPIASVVPKDPPEVLFSEEKYEKRFTFPENGRALGISQLSLEDAGIYSVKIDGKTSTFTLRVYGELAEPTVTCEDRNCSAGSCRFSLRCSVPGTGLGSISYLWSKGEQPWDEGPTVLVVNESSWNEPESLTCTARNPVSSRNITVVAPGGLCEAMRASHEGETNGFCPGIWDLNQKKWISPVLGAGSASQSYSDQGGWDEEQFPNPAAPRAFGVKVSPELALLRSGFPPCPGQEHPGGFPASQTPQIPDFFPHFSEHSG
uniref:Uncharacterized protein n=1 Tax=Corvus moneduloides TaxID=1196302 RepID=A0A8C3DI10_CORMO